MITQELKKTIAIPYQLVHASQFEHDDTVCHDYWVIS